MAKHVFVPGDAKPAGSGRTKGTPNKFTGDLKELCRAHAPAIVRRLAKIALTSKSEYAASKAAEILLDRGFGKARQPITGDDEGGPVTLRVTWAGAVPDDEGGPVVDVVPVGLLGPGVES